VPLGVSGIHFVETAAKVKVDASTLAKEDVAEQDVAKQDCGTPGPGI
jgi:hypothetical protein